MSPSVLQGLQNLLKRSSSTVFKKPSKLRSLLRAEHVKLPVLEAQLGDNLFHLVHLNL